MSFKKILAVAMACLMAIGAFAASALTLDVAENANETVVADDAVLAAEAGEWYVADATEYSIGTAAELAELAALVNEGNSFKGKTVTLTADIDLESKEWTPIGKSGSTFQGTFDGAGHTVSNLVITGSKSDVGLFGFTTDGEVKNLTVNNAEVSGYLNVGAVAGTPYTSKYTNIKLTGHVEVNGFAYVGGMFGKNLYADATNIVVDVDSTSYVYANSVSGDTAYRTYVGGVVGFMGEGTHGLYKVTSNIKVTGSTCDIGGITGIAHYGNNFVGVVCTADVYCENPGETEIGGIAGVWHDGGSVVTFEDCYYSGDTYIENEAGEFEKVEVAVTGPSYSGNEDDSKLIDDEITEPDAVAFVDGVVYTDINSAFAAIKDNSNVTVFEGEYDASLNINKANVTVKGAGEVLLNGAPYFKGNNFYVEGINFSYSSARDNITKGGTIKNCDFTATSNAFRYCYANGDVVFDGCKIVGGVYGIHFDAGKETVTIKNCEISGFNAFGSALSQLTIENTKFYQDEKSGYNHCNFWGDTALEDCIFTPDTTLSTCSEDILTTVDNCSVTDGSDVLARFSNGANEKGTVIIDGDVKSKTAKIGETYYKTLDDAIAAAVNGDVIDLLGKTVAVTESYNLAGKITFANGTMDFTGAYISDSAFRLDTAGESVAFDNVKIVREATEPAVYACYIVNVHTATSTATFTNCEIDVADVGSFVCNLSGAQNVEFTNCDIALTGDVKLVQQGGAVIDTCTIDAPEADVLFHNNVASVINNSTIVTDEITMANGTLDIKGNSDILANAVVVSEFVEAGAVIEDKITVEEGSSLVAQTINLALINEASEGTVMSLANIIEVAFEKVDGEAEGYDLYNINLVGANSETINRLNSADLTFVLEATAVTGGAMDYEILPVKNVTVTPDTTTPNENRFMFNFNGKDVAVIGGVDTANVITLAQVKVTGYGTYTFSVDTSAEANTTNVAHATTITDNIVDTFVPGGATGLGTLDLEDATTGEVTIAVPVRTLTVNVAFPNAVNDNAIAYQDMKVEIAGNIDGVHKTVTYNLGTDEVAMTNGAYVVTESKLVLNETYNVVVSGAGYRTARYSVTMTDNKTVNFWNNVKDNDTVVEEGKYSEKKNFLAGDIVGDNNINIYDLSAVVSYFATEITDEADYERYVKYDLNRDGVIDSKDVAYVLVSWGE